MARWVSGGREHECVAARQIARRKSSCDVSARFFATYAGGYAVWLAYGISIGSLPAGQRGAGADTQRRVLYLVDVLPSPPDSVLSIWPSEM